MPAAIVGNEKIYESEIKGQVRTQVYKLQLQEYTVRKKALDEAINNRLLAAEAARLCTLNSLAHAKAADTTMFELVRAHHGSVSAEHGIGTSKRHHYGELESPTKLALMKGIKKVFDPKGILNPGVLFE